MSESPPPLDYEPQPAPPEPGMPWLEFLGGVFVGLLLGLLSAAAGFALFAASAPSKVSSTARFTSVVPLLAALAYGIFLMTRPKRRPFGIGVVVGLTLFVMTFVSLCGGLP